jgi:diaminopimelate decarboxylase
MSQFTRKKILLAGKDDLKRYSLALKEILSQKVDVLTGSLKPVVDKILAKRTAILNLAKKYPTPFYLFDPKELQQSLDSYQNAFRHYLPKSSFYYALKVNYHPLVIEKVLKNGFGLDVSSGQELKIALKNRAKKIIFTGPGKTKEELSLALKYREKVTLNIDSFDELARLNALLNHSSKTIRAGIRVWPKNEASWNKFGIPLADLKKFWNLAKKQPKLKLEGLHFHQSWNYDATANLNFQKELSVYLKNNFSSADRSQIKFIDFGGGQRPQRLEGYFPEHYPQGELIRLAADYLDKKPKFSYRYFITDSATLEDQAKSISSGIKKNLQPLVDCEYYFEPGRIICNNSLHIVLKIMDLKKDFAIADGGINIVGWERFEFDYFPLIDLTHPSQKEIEFKIFGSLCMPQDCWGNYCYASKVKINDVILVPYQGALTYSIAQNFIKPIPKTYTLN